MITGRSTPRYELEHDIKGRTEYSAQILLIDLSSSGALIEHSRFLKPGSELTLRLCLSGNHLKVRASVVHSSVHEIQRLPGKAETPVYRIGVKFKDLEPSGKQMIEDLIMERLKEERREQPRLYLGRSVHIEENIELRALNIGSKGGLFASRYPLEPDNPYDFVFRIPGGEVKARGVVRHCQAWSRSSDSESRYQVGVEFVAYGSDGEELVQAFLSLLEHQERFLTET